MKKIILFSVFCSLLFVSCSDNDDYENDLNAQISTYRANAICSLLESVARHPENGTHLDSVARISLGVFNPSNIQNEKTEGENRGKVMSSLFESISRQPEADSLLSAITQKYIGAYKPEYFSDNTIYIARIIATENYIEAISRQPEASVSLKYAALKFLNYDFSTEK